MVLSAVMASLRARLGSNAAGRARDNYEYESLEGGDDRRTTTATTYDPHASVWTRQNRRLLKALVAVGVAALLFAVAVYG
jgi:hypothetical protein